jgi:hypothetical protein
MPRAPSSSTIELPRWLIIAASVAILFHLTALGVRVLAANSGPWPSMEGGGRMGPPQFAYQLYQSLPGGYLQLAQLTHNYHFDSDRPSQTGIYLEARLKDKDGNEIAKLTFPDANANSWMRHRQRLLVDKLGNDEPVIPPMTERVAAPGQPTEKVTIWDEYENGKARLKTVDLNSLIGSTRPNMRPSDVAMLYARAYARYLCRTHGAASAEIIRHYQNPIPPVVLYDDSIPSGAFDEATSNFGEFKR